MAGLPPVEPLGPSAWRRESLGPGYKSGYYGRYWGRLVARKENCRLPRESVEELDGFYHEVERALQGERSVEGFGQRLSGNYHNQGHNLIGKQCSAARNAYNAMCCSEMSARDPLFWRWHDHIEELMQEFKNKLPRYTREDFVLGSGISVGKVEVDLIKGA